MTIPKTFHRIWMGDRPIPPAEEAYGESWVRLNPGWTDRLWTDADLPTLQNQAEFDRSPNFSQKSDFVRYEVVQRHGGVYLDTDFECLKPIAPLFEGADAFLVREDSVNFASAIFGAVKGHPMLDAIIEALPASAAAHRGGPSNEATGPQFLTGVLRARPELLEGVAIIEPELFFPYPWDRPDLRDGPFPGAYGAHHWARSWVAEERWSARAFARRQARRLKRLRR